jgi:hypothetical protein
MVGIKPFLKYSGNTSDSKNTEILNIFRVSGSDKYCDFKIKVFSKHVVLKILNKEA